MDIVIQMYHNNPPTRTTSEIANPRSVWMRCAWDSFMISEALQAAEGDYESMAYVEAEARAYNQLVMSSNPPLNLPEGADPGYNVYHVMGDHAQIEALANAWADEIVRDANSVSGDDTYFDYFPDYICGLHQLCSQANPKLPDPINRALNAAWERYYGDPEAVDLLPDRMFS